MKKMKKLVSLLLTVVMVMAMTVVASAAQADLTGHTYKAYQIFKGTQADKTTALGQVEWGNDVDGEGLLTELKKIEIYQECENAADVAKVLSGYGDESLEANAFAKLAYAYKTGAGQTVTEGTNKINDSVGYYLIVDDTHFAEGATNTVRNLALLQITGDTITIKNKTSVPEVQKKIKETNDSVGETDEKPNPTDWQDGADYDINDVIDFQLTGTLPTDYDTYSKYKYVFHDTMSEGLTYTSLASVYVLNGSDKVYFAENDYVVGNTQNGFTVTFANLKTSSIAGAIKKDSKIIFEYKATLNEHAKYGSVGNPNEVYLEYSNNPNFTGEGDETGKTPKDTVIAFVYTIEANKVKPDNTALEGAGFTLYKYDADANVEKDEDKWKRVGTELTGETMTTFTWNGIDAGKYKLVETTVPNGYNKAADIIFEVVGTYTADMGSGVGTAPTLTGLLVKNEAGETISGDADTGATFSTTLAADTSKVSTNVVNNQGGTLPETGGIGTTIFYVIGAILVLGAGILLVTKKRMGADK